MDADSGICYNWLGGLFCVLRGEMSVINVTDVARYIFCRYEYEFGQKIDEMKLHKLMYFAQRESLIQTDEPLFAASFSGWRFGPVLKEIRAQYALGQFSNSFSEELLRDLKPVMDMVFSQYASKESWSLSRLTHGEYSWKKSREGIPDNMNSDRLISIQDIRVDAQRIKERRAALPIMN